MNTNDDSTFVIFERLFYSIVEVRFSKIFAYRENKLKNNPELFVV